MRTGKKAWGADPGYPTGVILRKTEPWKFLVMYGCARGQQTRAVQFHLNGAICGENLLKGLRLGDAVICAVSPENEAQLVHAIWYLALQNGCLLPDCGICYDDRKRAVISREEEAQILKNVGNHVLCIVEIDLAEDI